MWAQYTSDDMRCSGTAQWGNATDTAHEYDVHKANTADSYGTGSNSK